MTNPYSMGTYPAYPQQNQNIYSQGTKQKKNSGPSTFGMITLGALGGGAVGYFKNRYPVTKDGNVTDTFAKDVFDTNLKKNSSKNVKQYFEQLKNILKNIDSVSTPEEFKNLINKNKDVIEDQCRIISKDSLLDAVNSTNLKDSKKALKDSLQSIMNFELQKTKNAIKLGWNSSQKKFIKTDEFKDEKLFNIIKKTKNNAQMKKALKYGGITAGVLGALTMIYKMFIAPKNN